MTPTASALTHSPKPTFSISGLTLQNRIAEGNPEIADRVEQAIYEACAFVAESPMRGHSRTDLTRRAALLDSDSLAQLYDRVSARDFSRSDFRRSTR